MIEIDNIIKRVKDNINYDNMFDELSKSNTNLQDRKIKLLLKNYKPCPVCGTKYSIKNNNKMGISIDEFIKLLRNEYLEKNFRDFSYNLIIGQDTLKLKSKADIRNIIRICILIKTGRLIKPKIETKMKRLNR